MNRGDESGESSPFASSNPETPWTTPMSSAASSQQDIIQQHAPTNPETSWTTPMSSAASFQQDTTSGVQQHPLFSSDPLSGLGWQPPEPETTMVVARSAPFETLQNTNLSLPAPNMSYGSTSLNADIAAFNFTKDIDLSQSCDEVDLIAPNDNSQFTSDSHGNGFRPDWYNPEVYIRPNLSPPTLYNLPNTHGKRSPLQTHSVSFVPDLA